MTNSELLVKAREFARVNFNYYRRLNDYTRELLEREEEISFSALNIDITPFLEAVRDKNITEAQYWHRKLINLHIKQIKEKYYD